MTDPTRPVRDQADPRLFTLTVRCTCNYGPDTEGPEEDCPAHGRSIEWLWQQCDSLAAQRDALRATVDRVRALAEEWELLERHRRLLPLDAADDLRRALDGATQAAPRPDECGICGSTGDQAHAVKPHADAGIWPEDDLPAAQGVPLTEDRR